MADVSDAAEFWKSGSFKQRHLRAPRPLFGQVHEDSAVETFALSHAGARRHAVAIGSGGCTAFALLTQRPERLSIIDINPAQLWLIELKRAAFLRLGHEDLLAGFGTDASPFYPGLRDALPPETRRFWDAHRPLLARGLDRAGAAERILRRAMVAFRAFVHGSSAIRRMLSHTDLDRQREHFHREWNTWRWRAIFSVALNRRAIRMVYAPPFVEALPHSFSEQMLMQVNDVFLRFPTATNPYLWQSFLAQYPPGGDAGLPIHLQRDQFQTISHGLAHTELCNADLSDWLAVQPGRSIDFFSLSNILEVAGATYWKRLFLEIGRTAAPGAIVCLRSIFPTAPQLPGEHWRQDVELSAQAAGMDRSLGCRHINIYRLDSSNPRGQSGMA